jgi:hypothetical protein
LTGSPNFFKLYCTKMELLGGKGSMPEFNWCCDKFLKALDKAQLNVFGKVAKLDKNKVKEKLKDIHKKAKDAKIHKGIAPPKRERTGTNFPNYKVKPMDAGMLYDYLTFLKLPVSLASDHVSINVSLDDKKLKTLEKAIRENLGKYSTAMLKKHTKETYTYKLVSLSALSPCHKADPKNILKLKDILK